MTLKIFFFDFFDLNYIISQSIDCIIDSNFGNKPSRLQFNTVCGHSTVIQKWKTNLEYSSKPILRILESPSRTETAGNVGSSLKERQKILLCGL